MTLGVSTLHILYTRSAKAGIALTQNYAGGAKSLIVRDPLRGLFQRISFFNFMLWGVPKGIFWHNPLERRPLLRSENVVHKNV